MLSQNVSQDAATRLGISWINSEGVRAPPIVPPNELYGPTPYDINFHFPFRPQSLETQSISLVPFIPRLHAEAFFQYMVSHPDDALLMRFRVPDTIEELLEFFELHYRRNPANITFAALDRRTGQIGGIVSLENCDPINRTAAISFGLAFRRFRGTYGAPIAVALVLRYCLNLPTDAVPGLGLRRVTWTCHSKNVKSQTLALTLGMQLEAEQRWVRVHKGTKEGNELELRKGDPCRDGGVDSLVFVVCFDDWESGTKKSVADMLGLMRFEAKL